jgi:1-acyl-sn-glycerol-3-phosphate acyltransferase
MATVRALIRLVAFASVAILTVLLTKIIKILPVSRDTYLKYKSIAAQWFARISMQIIGLKLDIMGGAPQPPFFLVANHLSYVDVLPLWYAAKGTFIAKSEVENWPFFGFACKTLDVLFIDRSNSRDVARVNDLISTAYNPHQGVILFPEGTSSRGAGVLPFHASLLHFPAREEIPVYYASLSYTSSELDKPADRFVCWWVDMTFGDHFFSLLKIKSIHATLKFGDRPVINSDRKQLALILHQKVMDDFQPVVEGEKSVV